MKPLVVVLACSIALGTVEPAGAQSEARPPLIDAPPGVVTHPPTGSTVGMRPGDIVVHGRPLRLRLRSEPSGLTFFVKYAETYGQQSGMAVGLGGGWGYHGWGYGMGGVVPYAGQSYAVQYRPICSAPCDITLISGVHRFAVSLGDREPLSLPPLDVRQPSTVTVRYIDKRRLRRIGLAVFLVSTALGAGLTLGGVDYGITGDSIRNKPMFYSGVAIWSAGTIAGLALMFQNDRAEMAIQR